MLRDGTFPDYHRLVIQNKNKGTIMNDTSGDFVHLHVHTGFSLGNSTIRAADLLGEYRAAGLLAGHGHNRSA